jgi:hypothetical protein
MKTYLYLFALFFSLNSCKNDADIIDLRISKFTGIWKIEQINANDYWGGPLSWRDTDWGKQIKFTAEKEYLEKPNNDFELIGTYKIISDKQIEITLANPISSEYPTYQLDYDFDTQGRLTLYKNQHEGIVAEKYKLIDKFN